MSSSDTKLRQEMRRVDSREAQMAERQTSCLQTLIVTPPTHHAGYIQSFIVQLWPAVPR